LIARGISTHRKIFSKSMRRVRSVPPCCSPTSRRRILPGSGPHWLHLSGNNLHILHMESAGACPFQRHWSERLFRGFSKYHLIAGDVSFTPKMHSRMAVWLRRSHLFITGLKLRTCFYQPGRVAEWFKAPVLKFSGRRPYLFCSFTESPISSAFLAFSSVRCLFPSRPFPASSVAIWVAMYCECSLRSCADR
jgi:hypothetical protein